MELVKPSKPPICARSKTSQATIVMTEGITSGLGVRQRGRSRKFIESEENEIKTKPKMKKMKKAPELEKIDTGIEEVDSEEQDEDQDEEVVEVMYPQKVTFVLGAVQGRPPKMNEFFWDSKTSPILGKTTLNLPIVLNDLIDALKPLFKLKCFKDYVKENYLLGIVIPLSTVPVGRKKAMNQVQLVDDTLLLDENSGDFLKFVIIDQSMKVDPAAGQGRACEQQPGDSDFTITVLVGAAHYDGNFLASEPTGDKHSSKSSVTVRLGSSDAPMLGVKSPLTLQKIKAYTEKVWVTVNDEKVDLDNYEIRLLSSTEKAKTGEAASAPCLFTCNKIIGEMFQREHPGHITIVLVHPDLPDAKIAKIHGSAVDSERSTRLAICKLANDTSFYHVTTGKYPTFLRLFEFDSKISRDAKQTCMRELYLAASELLQKDIDWQKLEDLQRGKLLIETLLSDNDKVNVLTLPPGCALVTMAGGGNHVGSTQTVLTTLADTSISKMEVVYKISVRPGTSSSSSWVDEVATTTVGDLAIKLSQLPHNKLLSVQTAVSCGKNFRIAAQTFLLLEKIMATAGYDDSYFVVSDGVQKTSLRMKFFKAQDPPLEEDSDPPLEEESHGC